MDNDEPTIELIILNYHNYDNYTLYESVHLFLFVNYKV